MSNIRLPIAVCAAVAEILSGSHDTLDAVFLAAGAPPPPPKLAHDSKWKTWLSLAGKDPNVDSLAVLGNLIEEFMDLPPAPNTNSVGFIFGNTIDPQIAYKERRARLAKVLEEHGFRYFPGGRVLPNGETPLLVNEQPKGATPRGDSPRPSTIEDLLQTIVQGLPRAMHPLTHRRKGAIQLSFDTEYDIQDLLHSQLRPWVADIRPEEFTPSYAGSSTRVDFLLPKHRLVLELKRIRNKAHGRKVGEELIIDIAHYNSHPDCEILWCVIYDPQLLIPNPTGLVNDLEKIHASGKNQVNVKVCIFGP